MMKKIACLVLAMLIALPVLPAFAATEPGLVIEDPSNVNILKPLEATITVGAAFQYADIYVDNTKVDSFAANGSTNYQRSINLSSMGYLGEATLQAVLVYEDKTQTLTQPIILTKMDLAPSLMFEETFSKYDGSSGSMSMGFTSNSAGSASKYSYGTNETAIKMNLSKNGAFIQKSSLGLAKGAIISVEVDVMFDNNTQNPAEDEKPNAYLRLEPCDYGSHQYGYPDNGGTPLASFSLISKGGTIGSFQCYTQKWYNIRMVCNTIGKGVKVYIKEAGKTEYSMELEFPNYAFVGLKSIRLTGYQTTGNDGIIFDNFRVYEQRQHSDWYVKTTYTNESGENVSQLPVLNGTVNVKFSSDMGELENSVAKLTNTNGEEIPFTGAYDSEAFLYTITPTQQLRYGSEYQIEFPKGLKAKDGSVALNELPTVVKTEEYPVYVESVSLGTGVATVKVQDDEAVNESMIVCRYDDNKLIAVNYVTLVAGQGEYTVTLSNTDAKLKTVVYIIEGTATMNVKDIYIQNGVVEETTTALIYPPESHPRVYLNEEHIAYMQANKSGVYDQNFKYLRPRAEKALPAIPADKALSETISTRLTERALMYALGEVSEENAKETVAYTLEYLDNPTSSAVGYMNRYKDFGENAIETGSYVYDWCYDVMTEEQRTKLADLICAQLYSNEQRFRPDNVKSWGDIAGSAVSLPLEFNAIAAVALYDERPELYEAVMPKIQGSMADIVKMHGEAGALSDGSIAYSRETYTYRVAMLFDRMGYPDFYGEQENIGYKYIYSRLPYGAYVKQGDDFYQRGYTLGNYNNGTFANKPLGYLSVMEEDPYLRFEYLKAGFNTYGWEPMLLLESEIEPMLPDNLPLAFYVDEPRSEILARTSWQDGLDSPAVSALMSIHNRRTGDHDHGHIGEFQLYYKGPLTMPAGQYEGTGGTWGEPHWREYYSRTISANCMTVYDPNEQIMHNTSKVVANDGGQKMVTPKANDGTIVVSSYDEFMSDENMWAQTEAHCIGPNEKTPAFSYIKGDITNAYSRDKMQSYKRGMVFMDTFNETYPGVLVVYDRVVSKDASFKKKWLLQSVTEPMVTENKITIVNTQDGANGKLVNTTLLPQEVEIAKVGEVGKYIVDGKEYPASTGGSDSYKGGIRLEVSPKEANKEDIFLNAMYVTDADGNAPELPMIQEETDEFVGVTTLDRTVLFSKDSKRVSDGFTFTVRDNGYEEMLCFITDIEAGNWCIEGAEGQTVIAADSEGYSLTFSAKPGTYQIYPTTGTVTSLNFAEVQKEKIGDFTIKLGNTFTYVKSPNKIISKLPYFAIADFAERYLGAQTSQKGDILTIVLKDGVTLTLEKDSKTYSYQKGDETRNGTMKGAAFMENGVMYITPETIASDLGLTMTWTASTKQLKLQKK